MNHNLIPLVPGPVSVPQAIREAYLKDYGSADLEADYLELYSQNQDGLRRLLQTKNDVAIMSGEGMVALWGAVKSVLSQGSRVLVVSSGLFGSGFAPMAESCGAEVRLIERNDGSCPDMEEVRQAAFDFRPCVITAVHCETPSGILNPLAELGKIAHEVEALFCVDFVASAGGTPVPVDQWHIDLGLLGSQKCLSLLPDMAMVTVSPRAWDAIEKRRYEGYDALLPWRHALEEKYFPYTPNWQAAAALNVALQLIFDEGEEAVYRRHAETAALYRKGVAELGLSIWPREELSSPTVTAVRMPSGWTWPQLDRVLRSRGVVAGGTFGPLQGTLFRLGHMGSQAQPELIGQALYILKEILEK